MLEIQSIASALDVANEEDRDADATKELRFLDILRDWGTVRELDKAREQTGLKLTNSC